MSTTPAPARTSHDLVGLRILLVEDNFLIAGSIRRLLAEWGCIVVGPAASVQDGLKHVEDDQINGAILDINIHGGNSVPIAEALRARSIPFIFMTGYGSPMGLPPSLAGVPRVNKPIKASALEAVLLAEFVSR